MTVPQAFGEYELLDVIGGGMGIVYRARRRGESRDVAIKLLRQERLLDGEARARFSRELAALQRVRHPSICPLLAAGEIDGMPFLCMPLLSGSSLAAHIDAARERGAAEPWRQSVAWLATIAEAVQAAHDAGLVHRDIKPSNILIDADGAPHLLDFGLARLDADRFRHLTRTGQVIGTPTYLPPEQLETRRGAIDARSDVYGLGATLFELLTLAPPFAAETRAELYERILDGPLPDLAAHRDDLPRELVEVVEVALSRAPAHRQPSAAEFAADLRRAARGETPRWRRQPWPRRMLVAVRRRAPALLAAVASIVLGTYLMKLLAEQEVLAQVRDLAASGEEIRRSRERLIVAEHADLPPPWPEHVPALEDWLERARRIAADGPFDAALLAVDDPAVRALVVRRHALVRAIADVERRIEHAAGAAAVIAEQAKAWRDVAEAVAADLRFVVALEPQHGLLPLGADPDTGLMEFLHLASHQSGTAMPSRDPAGRLRLEPGHGIVFVLVPGGRTASLHGNGIAVLAPFFVAKHELTRHQHRQLDGGYDPSAWPLVRVPNGELQTVQHPVDNVRFDEVRAVLRRWGMDLPTDLQFDWVATGCGHAYDEAPGPENRLGHQDGYHLNAPVGSFPAGPCGLYDLFGNVAELVLDEFDHLALPRRDGDGLRSIGGEGAARTIRGGWHVGVPWPIDLRGLTLADQGRPQVGVRPVRALEVR